MRARLRSAWASVEPRIATRQALALLVVVALAVFWLESIAWPMAKGRDAWDYFNYYLSLLDGTPVFPDLMVFRTPVTPLVLGIPMSIGGSLALEILFSLLYAITIAAWACAALTFGRLTAVLTALVLLVYPGLATLYHQASSDAVFATGFALWSLGMVRTLRTPSTARFAWLGIGVAALVLTRPASQILLVGALLPLLAAGSARARGISALSFCAGAIVPLALWAGVNGIRYDEVTVARGGNAWIPFFRVFLADRAIDPANGSSSRRLGTAIEQHVLTLPPYRRLHVDLDTYLAGGSNFEAIRLIPLSDKVFGRGDELGVLRGAALEAIRAHPGEILGSMARNTWDFLRYPGTRGRVLRQPTSFPPPAPTITAANGRPMPSPASLSPLIPAIGMGMVWCPTDDYDRCVLDHPAAVFRDQARARRYVEITDRVRSWNRELPGRDGNAWLGDQLYRVANRFPTPPWWLALLVIGLVFRRPRLWRPVVALVAAGLLIVVVHAVSQLPAPEFALPVYPAFILAGLAAVTGYRREG